MPGRGHPQPGRHHARAHTPDAARAAELAAEPGAYQTDQFRNTDMVDGYRRLGEEVVEQVPGTIDAMCLYVGTAGCFLGVGRRCARTTRP